jgi:hypothetical protein
MISLKKWLFVSIACLGSLTAFNAFAKDRTANKFDLNQDFSKTFASDEAHAKLEAYKNSVCEFMVKGLHSVGPYTPPDDEKMYRNLDGLREHINLCKEKAEEFITKKDSFSGYEEYQRYVRDMTLSMCLAPSKGARYQWVRSRGMCFIKAAQISGDPQIEKAVLDCASPMGWHSTPAEWTMPVFDEMIRNTGFNPYLGNYGRFIDQPEIGKKFEECVTTTLEKR